MATSLSGEQSGAAVVLPDTLVAQLIDDAATLSHHLTQDLSELAALRGQLRAALVQAQLIRAINPDVFIPLAETYAIDGAHLAVLDRASAYSASCTVRVGQAGQANAQSSCLAILPHAACLNTISSALMLIQEIMAAVDVTESFPDALCLIDGSKISAIIAVNQFYNAIKQELPQQLHEWRAQAQQTPDREPGRTLSRFESRDWLSAYLKHPKIVGNLKLVTTTTLIRSHTPAMFGRFDDKTFASLVLEAGEVLGPVPLEVPSEPYHINDSYPFAGAMDAIGDTLTQIGSPNRLFHLYYRPDAPHGVYKIEMNAAFLENLATVGSLLSWWQLELCAPDLEEPYSFYVADRFAKEAVSVARSALTEITRRDVASDFAWFFTQPYRTPR